ncbi:MAG: hypothetical protein KGI06_00510 [Candidatus Micrarchaeota archaeon]|nr:hypothetical protein [Candidatus Micrarchaeota archaeon]
MGILNIFGKKDSAKGITEGPPYSVSTELIPYRLYAKKASSATLNIKVKNLTKDILLTSVVAESAGKVGFDEMVVSKQREIRIGEMQPGEQKEVSLGIYSSIGSDAGEYTIALTTIAHYRDYAHVLNAIKKRVLIELV